MGMNPSDLEEVYGPAASLLLTRLTAWHAPVRVRRRVSTLRVWHARCGAAVVLHEASSQHTHTCLTVPAHRPPWRRLRLACVSGQPTTPLLRVIRSFVVRGLLLRSLCCSLCAAPALTAAPWLQADAPSADSRHLTRFITEFLELGGVGSVLDVLQLPSSIGVPLSCSQLSPCALLLLLPGLLQPAKR